MWNTFIRKNLDEENDHDNNEVKIVPFVLEEVFISDPYDPKDNIDQENCLEDIINNIKIVIPSADVCNTVNKCQHDDHVAKQLVDPALHDFLKLCFLVDVVAELDPWLYIVELGREHVRVFGQYFTELHELTDLDAAVVVLVEFVANQSDVVDVSHFVFVHV